MRAASKIACSVPGGPGTGKAPKRPPKWLQVAALWRQKGALAKVLATAGRPERVQKGVAAARQCTDLLRKCPKKLAGNRFFGGGCSML